MVDIICRDADASASNVGYLQNVVPIFDDNLYALYLLGTDHDLGPLDDYSGHDRDLVVAGTPVVNAFNAELGDTDYYVAPFTGAQLGAAHGGITLISVGKDLFTGTPAANVQVMMISSNNASGVVSSAIYYDRSTSTPNLRGSAKNPTTALTQLAISNGHLTTANEFAAFTHKNDEGKVYRRYTGFAQASAVSTASGIDAPAGTLPFCLGSQNGQVLATDTRYAMNVAAFYDRVLTAAEIEQAYLMIQTYLAELSTPVVL
jgi:hypothetical protein